MSVGGPEVSFLGFWAYGLLGAAVVAASIVAVFAAAGLLGRARGGRPALFGFAALLILIGAAAMAVDVPGWRDRAPSHPAAAPDRDARPRPDDAATAAGTVYIQVPDMDARFAADAVSKALRSAGFRSPGIEVVNDGAPSRPEVRYFNPADRPVAERVASIAGGQGLARTSVREMSSYKAPPGQVELWYPAD